MKISIHFLFLLLPILFLGQKNRVTLSYHSAYIIERGEFSKLGLHLKLERKLGENWSTALEFSMNDYCRYDLEPYQFRLRSLWFFVTNNSSSSPHWPKPTLSRFHHWTWLMNYFLPVGDGNQKIMLGSGLTYRGGLEETHYERDY